MDTVTAQLATYEAGSFSRELTSLAKLYTSDLKYSGTGDNFDYKFKIFLDYYKQAAIPRDGLSEAISMILKDQALDYYFTCKFRSQIDHSIEFISNTIKNYFEGLEHKINAL